MRDDNHNNGGVGPEDEQGFDDYFEDDASHDPEASSPDEGPREATAVAPMDTVSDAEIGEDEDELPDDEEMDFLDHLEILRWHIIRSIIYVAVGMATSFWWIKYVIRAMTGILGDILEGTGGVMSEGPIFKSFQEVVSVWIKAALIAGLVAALPFVFLELWRFIEPALTKREKRMAIPIALGAPLLFACGASFAWVILPFMLRFLYRIGKSMLGEAGLILPSVGEYLNLVLSVMLAMGIVFQLPLVVGILARLGVMSSAFLARQRRYAYVFLAVIVAILTPTVDAVNWSLAMGPMVVLYEVSIWVARIVEPKEQKAG